MKKLSSSFVKLLQETPGAISISEAFAIFNIAFTAPQGIYLDLGTHAGKAAIAAAAGLKNGNFYLVDPVFDLSNKEAWSHSDQKTPENMPWPYVNDPDFKKNIVEKILSVSNHGIKPVLMGDFSENVIPKFEKYAYVFIDSDTHQGGLVMREVKALEDKMVEGGIIAFHDFGNQFREPKEAAEYLVNTDKYEWVKIDWEEIFNHVRENNYEQENNSWHQKGSKEFPCFVGAVKRIK